MAVIPRAEAFERLAARRFDLLVVGGGIVGAGIAAEAAHLGLAVALVDKGDFGSGTSSSSSKLVHGGLRYLKLGDVRLVREAHLERRALLQVVAPHLVRPLPFLFPVYRHGPYRPTTIRFGMWAYSLLAGDKLGGLARPARALRSVPDLRVEGLRGCGAYKDAWTFDARLTLANVRAAADAGATVANYAEVVELRQEGGRVSGAEVVDVETGATVSVAARAVVNAAGPWVDGLRRLEDPTAGSSYLLSKGVHVTVRQPAGWSAALTIPQDDVRVTFAVPWNGVLLLGTTDEPYEGSADDLVATDADIAQVLREAALAVGDDVVAPANVLHAFAGLRVLPQGAGSTTTARRETVMTRGSGGMLSIAGGKLTTYRRIALQALDHLRADLGLHALDRRPRPLPGATGLDSVQFPEGLPPSVRSNLLHLYGSLTAEVLAPAREDPELFEPLAPGAPDLAAQALYAVTHEWARTPEDVLRRRTALMLRGLGGAASANVAAASARPDRVPAAT